MRITLIILKEEKARGCGRAIDVELFARSAKMFLDSAI